jgi:hypothetical protein
MPFLVEQGQLVELHDYLSCHLTRESRRDAGRGNKCRGRSEDLRFIAKQFQVVASFHGPCRFIDKNVEAPKNIR